jgi:hypothetical protein
MSGCIPLGEELVKIAGYTCFLSRKRLGKNKIIFVLFSSPV